MSEGPVLVTGARGFAGAWLARALLEEGRAVAGLDRPERARPSTLALLGIEAEVESFTGDVRDPEAVRGALRGSGASTVFHLAARAIVRDAPAAPAEVFDVNVRGTWVLLEACRDAGVAGVVVASSDKAYGIHGELPYREEQALRPGAPYEASKAAADVIARSYWSAHGLPVAVTRFANLYGGGDTHWSRLVPAAICAALDGKALTLRSDGSPERDFLYAEDAAAAYIAIGDRLGSDVVRGEAFNAGGGRPYSVGEVVALICRLSGAEIEPAFEGPGSPDGEIDCQWADASKIQERTGWAQNVGLEEGLAQTIDWYRGHPDVRPPG